MFGCKSELTLACSTKRGIGKSNKENIEKSAIMAKKPGVLFFTIFFENIYSYFDKILQYCVKLNGLFKLIVLYLLIIE